MGRERELEQTERPIFLEMFGLLGWIPACCFGFIGSLRGPGWGLYYFALAAVPTAGCLLAAAFLRNRARRRQAAAGRAVRPLGVLRTAWLMIFGMALGRLDLIDRAEAEADRIAAGGQRLGQTRAYVVFRTVEGLGWLTAAGMFAVCVFLVRVVGPWIFTAFLVGMASYQWAALFRCKAEDAERAAMPAGPVRKEIDFNTALATLEREMAAEAAEQTRRKREQDARVMENDGQAATGRRAVRLADFRDTDFPTTTLQ